MPNVYSTQFFAVEGLTADVYSYVPPGYVDVLRDVDAYYNGVPAPVVQVFLLGDNGQTIMYLEWLPTSSSRTQTWRGRQVITTVMELYTYGGPVDVSVSGYRLTLP